MDVKCFIKFYSAFNCIIKYGCVYASLLIVFYDAMGISIDNF